MGLWESRLVVAGTAELIDTLQPGIGIYFGCKSIQGAISPPPKSAKKREPPEVVAQRQRELREMLTGQEVREGITIAFNCPACGARAVRASVAETIQHSRLAASSMPALMLIPAL